LITIGELYAGRLKRVLKSINRAFLQFVSPLKSGDRID
jgi:hypothetical protein